MKEITLTKVRGSNVDFLSIEITWKKERGNNANFSTIEILWKKVRGNNLDFSIIEITFKRVRGNDEDFFMREITSKKCVEMTWKFFEIWSSAYLQNIHFKLTSIRRGVLVALVVLCGNMAF